MADGLSPNYRGRVRGAPVRKGFDRAIQLFNLGARFRARPALDCLGGRGLVNLMIVSVATSLREIAAVYRTRAARSGRREIDRGSAGEVAGQRKGRFAAGLAAIDL